MKLTCSQQDLAKALAAVRLAISSTSLYHLPILNQVLLTAHAGQLTLAGVDLEMGVTYTIPAVVAEEGVTTCTAHLLAEFVGTHSPSTILTLATQEITQKAGKAGQKAGQKAENKAENKAASQPVQGLKISDGRSQVTLRTMDPGDFPEIPVRNTGAKRLTLDGALFRQAISEVAFAADDKSSRPVFTGVLFRVRGAQLTLAAADSFRLATRSIPLDTAPAEDIGDMLVPAAMLQKVAKLLPQKGTLDLAATSNRAILTIDEHCTIFMTLLAGQYPTYEAVIPKSLTTTAVVATADLQRAVRQSLVIAREQQQVVVVSLMPDDTGLVNDSMTLSAGDSAIPSSSFETSGDVVATLETTLSGPPLTIRLSAKFLLDVTRALGAERLTLGFTNEKQPVLITPEDAESDYQYVVMPIAVGR